MMVFGPVPSRRLGRSLGINNIPPKVCSYTCVYCQLGRAIKMQTKRQSFYDPGELLREVEIKIQMAKKANEHIDYLTFVSDGEPTLDIHLGREIDLMKPLGIKIAVITNSSLTWKDDVKEDLSKADWVSLKVDTIQDSVWRKINRPCSSLSLQKILDGILEFSRQYNGKLVTETMLVGGLNDAEDQIKEAGEFIKQLSVDTAFLSVPTRPPAEQWVHPPSEGQLVLAYELFHSRLKDVEYLIGYEGNAFAFTGHAEEDLLSITSVHPMREDAVDEFLKKAKSGWTLVKRLIVENKITETEYNNKRYFVRNFTV